MPENCITHNNHYVPQFYLKNWSLDGKQIYVYSLLVPDPRIPYWVLKNIKSTAVWNDLYTRNSGEKEIDDFEKWFDIEFESPVKKVFDDILNGNNLDEDESKILSHFVGAQYLRTPARLNKLMAQWRTEMPRVVEDVLRNVTKQLKSGELVTDNKKQIVETDKLLPIKVSC